MITLKDFFSFKHNRFFWINLLLMVALLVAAPLAALQWLDSYTRHNETWVVPDVKGMDLATAQREFAKQSLKFAVADSSYVKGKAPGSILDQNPAGGSRVKEGRTIYLTLNTASAPQVSVPDVMDNSSLRQAEAKLHALGFKTTEPEYISGEKDWVYSVKYRGRALRAGEKIPHEATLTLCVGNGNEDLFESDSLGIGSGNRNAETTETDIDESWF